MSGVRRRLSVVALLWLLAHVSTVALSLTGVCCNVGSEATVADEDVCCQGLAPGQICPLHKHSSGHHQPSSRSAPAPSSPDGCRMQAGCDSMTVMLNALSLDLGLLPETSVAADLPAADQVNAPGVHPPTRTTIPDLPPPRS